MSAAEVGPRAGGDPELEAALGLLQELIWTHPVAFQRGYAALVREGRAHAKSPEGAALREKLERSDFVARARMVWDVLSMSAFSPEGDEALPSVFVDVMARAATSLDLEPLLARVFKEKLR